MSLSRLTRRIQEQFAHRNGSEPTRPAPRLIVSLYQDGDGVRLEIADGIRVSLLRMVLQEATEHVRTQALIGAVVARLQPEAPTALHGPAPGASPELTAVPTPPQEVPCATPESSSSPPAA